MRRHGTAGADVSGSRSRLNALIMIRDGTCPAFFLPARADPRPRPQSVSSANALAQARRQTVDVTSSGQERSTPIKWWYKAGGIPNRNADSPAFRRHRGRGGRGGKGGKGNGGKGNGGATTTSAAQTESTSAPGTTSAPEDTTSSVEETTSSEAAETTTSEDAAETTTSEQAETTSEPASSSETSTTEETTTTSDKPSETTTQAPQQTGDPDQAIGDLDTGLKDTIEVCREPDGKTLCFLILANTKSMSPSLSG